MSEYSQEYQRGFADGRHSKRDELATVQRERDALRTPLSNTEGAWKQALESEKYYKKQHDHMLVQLRQEQNNANLLRINLNDARRICDSPGCTAAVIRKDDGTRVCASGHKSRWVKRADLDLALDEVKRVEKWALTCWSANTVWKDRPAPVAAMLATRTKEATT